MLRKLTIKNIALIRELSIDLEKGLNVLSGETGAGKSLVIDSISLMLGLRADKTLITAGEEEASVIAVFEVEEDSSALTFLEEIGLERDSTIIVYRKIFSNGKNECRVNGTPFSLSMLKQLTSRIIDLHGQFDHQSLLKPALHINILDKFAPENIDRIKLNLQKLVIERNNILSSLAEYEGSDADRARTIDLLKFQIDEIERANIENGEEEELKIRRAKIVNQEKIAAALTNAIADLDAGGFANIESLLGGAVSQLSNVSSFDSGIEEQLKRLQSLKYEFSDILTEIKDLGSSFDFDEALADSVEERLDEIRLIKKKYGASIEEVSAFLDSAQKKLERLETSDEIIKKLNERLSVVETKIFTEQEKLSIERKRIAKLFESAVLAELSDLGMGGSVFVVNIQRDETKISVNGWDEVEFLLSTNIGEPVKPLSKIISGGEMSRFMLGIKNITASLEKIETMIFDEIDTGISGKMGRITAEKLAAISRDFQVICVSHLPQIVAMADTNFLIKKSTTNGKTSTNVLHIFGEKKIDEVARLAGGEEGSNSSKTHALDLISSCDKFKQTSLK